MGEILSHAEVEAILSAVEPSPHRISVSQSAQVPRHDDSAWEAYDFRRPEPCRDDLLHVLGLVHAGLCKQLKTRLSSLLQSSIQVHPVGVCSTTPREFLDGAETPVLICRVSDARQRPHSLLVWELPLAHSLISQLLGGHSGETRNTPYRSATEIELRLLARPNTAFLEELSQVLRIDESSGLSFTSTHTCVDELPQEFTNLPVVWISFEIACSDSRGLLHCGLPRHFVTTEGRALALPSSSDSGFRPKSITTGPLSQAASGVEVVVSANLARLRLRATDMAALQVGDILMTDATRTGTATLELAGQALFQADIGTTDGKQAVRLAAPVRP